MRNINDKFIKKIEASFLDFIVGDSLSGNSETTQLYGEKLSNFFNSKYALPVSSGGAAILAALYSIGVRDFDEVILSPTCPTCTVYPILALGAIPIFCDTSLNSFSLNVDDLKKKITSKTKCILCVPMWGYPIEIDELSNLAKKYNIPLIFDLAQGHFIKWNSQYLNKYADISCYSTHNRKILSTGEGGFLLTDREDVYNVCFDFTRYDNLKGKKFGMNFLQSGLQSAMGIFNLNNITYNLQKRKLNAKKILENAKDEIVSEFNVISSGEPDYYTLLLRFEDSNITHEFIQHMYKNGIPSDILRYNYKLVFHYDYFYKYFSECPNAQKIKESITTVPVHPGLRDQDIEYIIDVINQFQF